MIIERKSVVNMFIVTQWANKTRRLLVNIKLMSIILQASALMPAPSKVLGGLKLSSEYCEAVDTFIGNGNSVQQTKKAVSILLTNSLMC